MDNQELRELFYRNIEAYNKVVIPDQEAFIKQLFEINSNQRKRKEIITAPPKKREQKVKPPKEKKPPKPDPRPLIVPKLKPNEKYCSSCGEVFLSNGWTLTCNLCAATGMGLDDRIDLFYRDEFTCVYCGKTMDDGIILHIDHIVPVSKGGDDTAANLVTSCRTCNCSKLDKPLAKDREATTLAIVSDRNDLHGISPSKAMKIGIYDADGRRKRLKRKTLETA